MDENLPNASLEGEIHYCAVHNDRDTELRCNRCDRYMCIDCAKRTPDWLYLPGMCARAREQVFRGHHARLHAGRHNKPGRRRDRRVCHHVAGWIPVTGHNHRAGAGRQHSADRLAIDRTPTRAIQRLCLRGGCAGGRRRRRLFLHRFKHTDHHISGAGYFDSLRPIQGVHLAARRRRKGLLHSCRLIGLLSE